MLFQPFLWLLTTAFRFFPWPTRPGLRAVGQPGSDSPVLLTCNFALTVARVKRALRGIDAWLLVADSRGINVWCAAGGGHLSTHSAVSALKTTGIADQVAHRRVILPQLAATGIEADEVRERTGWEVIWGPADARDLPAYLHGKETTAMRQVHFDLRQRLEMAIMWAAPLTILGLGLLLLWPYLFLPFVALVWCLTLMIYLAFPLYEPLIARGGLVSFLALAGLSALVALVLLLPFTSYVPTFVSFVPFVIVVPLLLTFDIAGSTPLYKSWSHEEHRYQVVLDADLCIACERCALVCPRGVFAVSDVASLPHADLCEQCGACIVQCPTDALCFTAPDGELISPDETRRFKLNLMGQRGRLKD